jgi:prepilin-type N-terminal cleavage/methylation domain-containing protein
MTMRPKHVMRRAFTIVELLIVIAIIGVLMSLIVPAVASVRAEAKSTECLSNLRQIFAAIEISRQQRDSLLPFAAPLPVPPGQTALIPALPEVLKGIMNQQSPAWLCPGDQTIDSELLGTSYSYVAGAFMVFEPPMVLPAGTIESADAARKRVVRLVTNRYTSGYLRYVPLVVDSGPYHDHGDRDPHNGVFLDGNARVIQPKDHEIAPPDE